MAVFLRLRVFDKIIQLAKFTNTAYSGKLHPEVHILVAFGLGIGFKNHRYMKTISL